MKVKLLTSCLAVSALVSCNERRPPQVTQSTTSPKVINQIVQSAPDEKWPPVTKNTVKNVLQENYLVVLDDSGSMKGKKLKQAKQALQSLCDSLPQDHNLALCCLNSKVNVPLGTDNRSSFKKTLSQIRSAGNTPLTKSIRSAIKDITTQASKQKGYGAYHVIVVTDGESSDGNPVSEVTSAVTHTSIQFHVIGFQVDDHALNVKGYVDYKTANNAEELTKAFEEVAAETNNFSDPTEFTN